MFTYKFSLLMPVFRQAYLPEAIAAVRAQTYEQWELLVSPGTGVPTDDPRIRTVDRLSDNTPDTLNHLVSVSTGDVFAVVADDDILDPMALSAVATYLRSNPWLVGRMRTTSGAIVGGPCDGVTDANLIPLPATFWTREAAIKTGPFDPRFHLCFDWDYWIRMWAAVGKPRFIENVLTEYREHEGQATNMFSEAVRLEAEAVRGKHAIFS